jgi:hypothetical protein
MKKPFYKKTKQQLLLKFLYCISNYEKSKYSEKELNKLFQNETNNVLKVLDDLPFLEITHNKDKSITVLIKNHYDLLKEIQNVRRILDYDGQDILIKINIVYSLLFAFLSVFLLSSQYILDRDFNNYQKEFNELNIKSDLTITKSSLDEVSISSYYLNNISYISPQICLLNRGSIDSGWINIKLSGSNIINYNTTLSNLVSKNYSCVSIPISLKDKSAVNSTVDVEFDCLNCMESKIHRYFMILN